MIHKEFNEVPKGFKRLEGATTAPRDKVWITNGKSLFGSTQGVNEDIFELTDLEIIGNIHENGDLLEEKWQ